MIKLSSVLLALTIGFVSVNADTITIRQTGTITKENVINLSKDELAEVNKLSSELKASNLNIADLKTGKAITADQAAKLNRIVQIIEKDSLAAAVVGGNTISTASTTGFAVGTWGAISAALLTALALGTSDSSASTHSHH